MVAAQRLGERESASNELSEYDPMPGIFLSHSSNDRESVEEFKAVLRERGYRSLFIDYDPEHGVPAGSLWERELYRSLKLSGAVIVLCSPDSMSSRWCFAEIAQAKALGKAIFPVISSMVADARTHDALPLLAFTLREMYQRSREQSRFTVKTYRDELGGINGAVARVVERIKSETAWTPEVGQALRRAFLKLSRVNDEGQFTRQPCRWNELPDVAAPVLEAFVTARLLSSNGDVVDVAHESLFRVWPELARWLDEARDLMRFKKGIQDEAIDWLSHARSVDRLLTGARVSEARRWLASNAEDFSGVQAEYLEASIAAEEDRFARERAQQEKLRRLARNLLIGVVVASVLAVFALCTGSYAIIKRNEANSKARAAKKSEDNEKHQRELAEEATKREKAQTVLAKAQARIATSRQLSALADSELDERLDLALVLAVEAVRIENTFEARHSLLKVLHSRPRLRKYLRTTRGAIHSVALSRDGRTLAGGYDGGVVLWDTAGGLAIADETLVVPEGRVTSVVFSRDDRTLAAGFTGGVVLWSIKDRARLAGQPMLVTDGPVTSVAFSPDGKILAAGFGDSTNADNGAGGVVLWDVPGLKRVAEEPLVVCEGYVASVAFSPDGRTLVSGHGAKVSGVLLWDALSRSA